MTLKPYFKSIEQEAEEFQITHERNKQLRWDLTLLWPNEIDGTESYDNLGPSLIRGFLRLPADTTEEQTRKVVHSLLSLGKAERFFREVEGTFAWKIRQECEDRWGKYERLIFIENAAVGNCRVKPVIKEITVYEADCSGPIEITVGTQGEVP